MEMRVSSPKPVGLSPSDCISDPEEKEVSDEDDDDRNHKHRRRETRSQSSEREGFDQVLTRPYRKRNKHFENGHPYRENDSQTSESWKNGNMSPLEKEFSMKFDRRRPGLMAFPRAPLDLNPRIRGNQTFPGDPGPGRGRGREYGSWNQHDSRFSSVDIASQLVPQGSIPPSLFAGRGLPNVSNAQSASWGAFGLIPGVPNGGLDTLHSIGLQGQVRTPINPLLNMGIARQRCRDFEERGFCLRGDMCPMEHGVNRIVVEDVQSLSQFNLPVSLPSAHLHGTPAGPGSLPSVSASSASLMSSKGLHNRSSKPGMADDGSGLNGAYSGPMSAGGTDLYDPDQPLWNNDGLETSAPLLSTHSPKIDETESMLNDDTSDRQHVRLNDGSDNELPIRNTRTAIGSQGSSLSVWGRMRGSKGGLDMKEKNDAMVSSSNYLENETKEDQEAVVSAQGTARHGKRIVTEGAGPNGLVYSSNPHGDSMRNIRKSSQKAHRTLFVNGIPPNNNKREALLSHFRRFGEVIDIHIPSNSERAFVQFSKREEAEAALRAPDAVMGNRFVKLWWANRDNIPDDGTSSGNGVSGTRGGTAAFVSTHPSVASKGKDNLKGPVPKGCILQAPDASFPSSDQSKTVNANGPKVPPMQKKLELEQLREELRKKQEMLDQKRNDFRRKLDQLAKQKTGPKGEIVAEQAAKRHKVGVADDIAKSAIPRSTGSVAAVASPNAEVVIDKNKSVENVLSHGSKTPTDMVTQESPGLKQPIQQLVPVGAPFLINRYKLDNRPTTFKIIPPLPTALANVSVLKEHFAPYGDLSTVELEDPEGHVGTDKLDTSENCSARIAFTTRRSAERAFVNGKCWEGHNLQFVWLTTSSSSNAVGGSENSPSTTPKGMIDTDIQPAEKLACSASQETVVLGNGENEHSERRSDVTNMEQSEDAQPSPTTPISSEKESPKEDGC